MKRKKSVLQYTSETADDSLKKRRKNKKIKNVFRWTSEENFLYCRALKHFEKDLSSEEAIRRRNKVFKCM